MFTYEILSLQQTLEQQQRRKDIYQALTGNMSEIFSFFMGLIEMHVREFREKTAAGDYAGAASNGRVVQVRDISRACWVQKLVKQFKL